MLYFFYGTDIDKARSKSHDLVDSLRKKKPDASFFILNSENFNSNILQEYIGGQGLFSNKYIILLDRICENKETKDNFLDFIKPISESENIFVLLEGKLDKVTATKIEKKSEKFLKFDLPEKSFKKDFNAFGLADAYANRNKKDAWILYRQAIYNGEAPEALHGMIFWKLKTILLSGGNNIWKKEDLIISLEKLIDMYHLSRRGQGELENSLEIFILS
jgi:DNA polymerase III delta subunit